jgi:twitching motility protein PilT
MSNSMNMRQLLEAMVTRGASDLHIKAGSAPGLRVQGELKPIESLDALTPETCRSLIYELLREDQIQTYERDRDLDFSKGIEGLARFRINLFHQRGTCGAVLRLIPIQVPRLEDMGYPEIVRQLCGKPRGLILVTGPTGSGKSTTLAAMIDYINRTESSHILTLEDPIEFIHTDKRCFVNQREIGSDSKSFSAALRAALREDPDVILVGELRDLETIGLAITAAETGHVVFGTLHTTSAMQTIDRIIDVFPHEAQQQVRTQLSVTLQGVISQTLLPQIGGGRCCVQEIMVGTDAVRSLVREGKTPQLINILQTSGSSGMQTLEASLAKCVLERKATPEDAVAKANNPQALTQVLEKAGFKVRPPDIDCPPSYSPSAGSQAGASGLPGTPSLSSPSRGAGTPSLPGASSAGGKGSPVGQATLGDAFAKFRNKRVEKA